MVWVYLIFQSQCLHLGEVWLPQNKNVEQKSNHLMNQCLLNWRLGGHLVGRKSRLGGKVLAWYERVQNE